MIIEEVVVTARKREDGLEPHWITASCGDVQAKAVYPFARVDASA